MISFIFIIRSRAKWISVTEQSFGCNCTCVKVACIHHVVVHSDLLRLRFQNPPFADHAKRIGVTFSSLHVKNFYVFHENDRCFLLFTCYV